MDSKIEEGVRSLLKPICDVYKNDLNFDQNQVWEPKLGDPLLISQMKNSHLLNSLRWWRNWYRPTFARWSKAHSNEREYKKFTNIRRKLEGKELEVFDKYMENIGHTRCMHLNPKYKYLWEEALKRGIINGNK